MMRQESNNSTQNSTQPGFDRGAEMDELNFSDDKSTPSFNDLETESEQDRDQILAEASDVGLTGAATPEHEPTNDDMSPETLIQEDGARSPREPGGNGPIDKQFSTVDENEIGSGSGLDEAEMARVQPLDGKQWDGNLNEPLSSAPSLDAGDDYDEDLDEEEE